MPQIRTTRTAAKRKEFLARLAESGSITAAAKLCDIPRQTLYDWRSSDPAFAAAWDKAREIGLDALEDEAIRRATIGEERPEFWNHGKRITPRKYSDLLLMFLLKHRRPQHYGSPSLNDPRSPANSTEDQLVIEATASPPTALKAKITT